MKGAGSIYRRGKIWWIKFYRHGRVVRESTGTESEKLARQYLGQRMGDLKGDAPKRRITFDTMAADIEADYIINHRKSLKRSLKPRIASLTKFFGGMRANDITEFAIRRYVAQRVEGRAANGTINLELAALSKMFRLARESGQLVHTPIIKKLTPALPRAGFVTREDFARLMGHLPARLQAPVEFMYRTGWRVSEMRTLEWRDVDLPGRSMGLRAENSKNRRPRVFPLRGELLALIKAAHAKRNLGTKRVFHVKGQPIGDFRKAWATATRAAALSGIIVHDLRRSAVRNMVRAGIPERVAMELSGHKTRAIFERYNIVSEADLSEAAERIEKHLAVPASVDPKEATK